MYKGDNTKEPEEIDTRVRSIWKLCKFYLFLNLVLCDINVWPYVTKAKSESMFQ